ncbi:30S ribosomal protein S13, partial [Pseudoalteromonas shioyasakiensis]|uniref:30S ribosomal protein S13 n=1 Tax=Pseudoalteromonas shioyasakiensis TaxID=1190813 RepID=UPI003B513C0E
MARISGVDLPRDKRVEIGLTYVFGVGRSRSHQVLDSLDIDYNLKVRDLSDAEVLRIRQYIEANYKVEGDLRRQVAQNIKRKIEIGCYQGLRHRR